MNVPQNRICTKLFSFAVLTVAILWSSAIVAETIYVGDVKDLGTNWSITEDTSVLYKDGASQKTINHSGTIAFTGSQTVTINSPTSDVTYFNQNGNMTGSGTVVKTGAGSMYFKGNYSAFSGTLKASEGFLGFMASNNADSNYNNLVVDGGTLQFCNKEFDRMVFNVSFTGNGGTFDMSSSYNNHLRSGNTSTITVPANATTTGTFSGSLNLNNGTLTYNIGANSSINVSAGQLNYGTIYKTSAGTVNISGSLGGSKSTPNYVPTITSEEGVINIGTATTPNANANYVRSFQLGQVSGKSATINYYGGTGSLNTYDTIRFGNAGIGTFNQYSGTVNAYNTSNYLADGSGSTGTINIYGGTFRAHSELCIATRGTGTINVYSGGEFVANNLKVGGGYDSNAKGYLNISGGTVSAGYIKYGRYNGSTYGEISLRGGTFNLTGNIERFSNVTAKMYLGEGTINVNNNSAWDGSIGITFDGKGLNGATGKTTTINVASGKTLTMNGAIFAESDSVIDYKGTGKWVVNGYSAIGNYSNGTLNIYSGTVNFAKELYLGNNSTSAVGTLNLYGGEYTTNESFTIATRGTGYLNIYDGKMTIAGTLNVGGGHNYTSSKGYANINGGTLTTNGISFGRSGSDKATTGVLSLRGGTINLSGGVSRLNNSSATMNLGKGTINVTANSSWVSGINLTFDGKDASGTTGNETVLNIASGTTTTINTVSGSNLFMENAVVTKKGAGTLNLSNLWLIVGQDGTSTFNINEGTVTTNYEVLLGNMSSSSSGTLNINGGTYSSSANFTIATRGTGEVNINSGTMTVSTMYIGGGHANGSKGTLNVNGGTLNVSQFYFGRSTGSNTGIINLRDGVINLSGNVSRQGNSASTMNLGKGTINVTANSSWVNAIKINIDGLDKDGNTGNATVFNIASGTTTTIDSDLYGAGILHKTGAGTLKYTGNSNNFNGAGQSGTIKVSAGTFDFVPDNYQDQTYKNIVLDGGRFNFNRKFERMHVMAEFTTNGGTIDFGSSSYNNHLANGSTDSTISIAANATAKGYLTNDLNLNGGRLNINVGENSTIEASVRFWNTGSIVKDGAGTLLLTNANNAFKSGLIINKGVVKTTSDSGNNYSCIGDASNPITVNEGGTLWIASTGRATGFHTGAVTVNGGTILIDGSDTSFGAGQTITLKGNALISSSAGTSSGAWRMRNSGFNLTVGGDSTATNATISTTSLIVHEDLKVNLVGANDVLTISSPNIYRYSNSTGTSAESLRVEGLGTLNLNSSNATFYKMLVGMDASSNVTMNVTGGKVTFNEVGSETWKDNVIGNSGIGKVNITGGELVINSGSGVGTWMANQWNNAYNTAGVSSSLNTSGTGKFTINSGLVVGTRGTAEVNISSYGNTVSSLSLGGGYDVANSKGTLNISDGSLTINGGINFGNSNSSNSTGIWKMHDATLTLNGSVNRQSKSTASATFGNATLNINANSSWAAGITLTLDGLDSDGNKQADGTPYATTFNIASGTTTTIDSDLYGTGILHKTGAGTLTFTGNNNNFNGAGKTGTIKVSAGTFNFSPDNYQDQTYQNIIVDGGKFNFSRYIERMHIQAEFTENGGSIDFNNVNNHLAYGSTDSIISMVANAKATGYLTNDLNLNGGQLTIDVGENSTIEASVRLWNSGSLVKTGAGKLVLTNTGNANTGLTTISEGELVINSGSLVGGSIQDDSVLTYRINSSSGKTISNAISGDGTLNVVFEDNADASWTCFSDLSNFTGDIVLSSVSGNSGKNGNKFYTGFGSKINSEATFTVGTATQLFVPSDSQVIANDITITGTGNNEDRGSIRLGGTISGTITVDTWANIGTEGGTISGDITTVEDTDGTLQVGTGPQYAGATFSGVLKDNGTGKLSLTLANGPLTLTGVNTYTGETRVNAGNNGANTQLILNTKDAIATSGSVYLNNGKIVLNADQTLSNLYGTGTVTTSSNKNLTINGTLPYEESKIFSGKIQLGTGSITKTGDGVTNLYGTATGNLAASVMYTDGGRLNLKGEFTGELVVGKEGASNEGVIFSPGNSVGTALIHGNVTFNAGSTLLLEQDATGMDELLLDTGNSITMDSHALMELTMGQAISGATYTIIENGQDFTGEQATDSYWNSLLTPGSNYFWNLSVDGNRVLAQIDPNAVPEPSTWLMLILGVAGLMKVARKRSARQ